MPEETDKPVSRRESDIRWTAHYREHDNADKVLDARLEGMNEFRSQLQRQAATFVTRELFDNYNKEQSSKIDGNASSSGEKYDAIFNAIVSRHEADTEAIRTEIQSEREHRKTFEGSINTWKWIATFLGASGVGGVILMFISR